MEVLNRVSILNRLVSLTIEDDIGTVWKFDKISERELKIQSRDKHGVEDELTLRYEIKSKQLIGKLGDISTRLVPMGFNKNYLVRDGGALRGIYFSKEAIEGDHTIGYVGLDSCYIDLKVDERHNRKVFRVQLGDLKILVGVRLECSGFFSSAGYIITVDGNLKHGIGMCKDDIFTEKDIF